MVLLIEESRAHLSIDGDEEYVQQINNKEVENSNFDATQFLSQDSLFT